MSERYIVIRGRDKGFSDETDIVFRSDNIDEAHSKMESIMSSDHKYAVWDMHKGDPFELKYIVQKA